MNETMTRVDNREQGPQPERYANIQAFRESYALTKRLNTDQLGEEPAKEQLNDRIPESIYIALDGGSKANRGKFWKETAPQKTYGDQMLEWLHGSKERGTSGISKWIDAQKDPEVQEMLRGVSLVGDNARDIPTFRGGLQGLIDTINETVTGPKLELSDISSVSDTDVRALSFYQNYLNSNIPDEPALGTEELMNQLLARVTYSLDNPSSQDIDKAFAKLQKIAPLLRVTGIDAQHAFAAVMAAKIHTQKEMNKVAGVAVTALKPTDTKALEFIRDSKKLVEEKAAQSTAPEANGEPGEDEGSMPLTEWFAEVADPPARKEDSKGYWIGGGIPNPDEVVARLIQQNKLNDLVRIEPFWDANDLTNFKPAQDFNPEQNPSGRFAKLEDLTDGDSGLLALAGIAAQTPEEQARLFQTFGKVVLEVYKRNPDLLEAFLKKQLDNNANAMNSFIIYEQNSPPIKQPQREIFKHYGLKPPTSQEDVAEFRTKLSSLYASNEEFKQDWDMLNKEIHTYLLDSLSEDSHKLLAFSEAEDGTLEYNQEQTIAQWKERLSTGELETAISSGKVTSGDLRQIEFLSHAVKIADKDGLVDWLQNSDTTSASPESPESGNPQPAASSESIEATQPITTAQDADATKVQQSTEQVFAAVNAGIDEEYRKIEAESGAMPKQELGVQLAERAKSLDELESWPNTKHVITMHENEYNSQRGHEDSELVQTLTDSLHAYNISGDVITRAVGKAEMTAIIAQQAVASLDGQPNVLFSPGFSPALAMFDGRMHERVDSPRHVPDDRDKGGYIVVFKKEGALSNVASQIEGGDIGVKASISLESVVGLYRIDRKDVGFPASLLGGGKEVIITQLLPNEEEVRHDNTQPPANAGGGGVTVVQGQPAVPAAQSSGEDKKKGIPSDDQPGGVQGVVDKVEHGFKAVEAFEEEHPVLTKAIIAAIGIGDALYAHHEAQKAEARIQSQDTIEKGKGDIVEVKHATQESYDGAKNRANAARELLERYNHIRKTTNSYEEIQKLDDELKAKGLNQQEYKLIINADGTKPELRTLHHEFDSGKESFDEQVVVFVNETNNTLVVDPNTDRPLFINKDAYLRKKFFGSSASRVGNIADTTYDVPRFDNDGSLIGVYYLFLTEDQADFLKEQEASSQQSFTSAKHVDTSGKSRTGYVAPRQTVSQ